MRVVNKGQNFTILHFVIQSGINFMSSDFFSILNANPKELKQWNRKIKEGIIVVG